MNIVIYFSKCQQRHSKSPQAKFPQSCFMSWNQRGVVKCVGEMFSSGAEEFAKANCKFRAAVPGFLLSGHGLYAWGATAADARRHVEGLEFLLACHLEERRLR